MVLGIMQEPYDVSATSWRRRVPLGRTVGNSVGGRKNNGLLVLMLRLRAFSSSNLEYCLGLAWELLGIVWESLGNCWELFGNCLGIVWDLLATSVGIVWELVWNCSEEK